MKHTEKELFHIKESISQMWRLVLSQLEKSRQAFVNNDMEIAREVISREKWVNTSELKIDSDCENFIALYSPVAVDLRLILSMLKISGTLERIGDFAEGIARHVIETNCSHVSSELKDQLQFELMFDTVISMLSDSYVSLESESTRLSGKILLKDEVVDDIYAKGLDILTAHIQKDPNDAECALRTIILLRKIERIGDHCSNIVEEIVFYIDAKVLKHTKHKE